LIKVCDKTFDFGWIDINFVRFCPNVAIVAANNGVLDAIGGQKLVLYVAIPTHDASCGFEMVTSGSSDQQLLKPLLLILVSSYQDKSV
jgi:hypothetical protein